MERKKLTALLSVRRVSDKPRLCLPTHGRAVQLRPTERPTRAPRERVWTGMEMHLGNLMHRKIVVLGPRLLGGATDQDKLETVTLVGIDLAGIWIESEEATNRIASRFRVKPSAPSAFFIPFAQITTIVASLEAAAPVATIFSETQAPES